MDTQGHRRPARQRKSEGLTSLPSIHFIVLGVFCISCTNWEVYVQFVRVDPWYQILLIAGLSVRFKKGVSQRFTPDRLWAQRFVTDFWWRGLRLCHPARVILFGHRELVLSWLCVRQGQWSFLQCQLMMSWRTMVDKLKLEGKISRVDEKFHDLDAMECVARTESRSQWWGSGLQLHYGHHRVGSSQSQVECSSMAPGQRGRFLHLERWMELR